MSESVVYRNSLALDTTLGEYRLESVLGAGGFGITYLARDTHLDKPVAIKEYLPGDMAVRALDGSVVPVSSDHGNDYRWGLERFILEARTLARFSHPHIVRVNRYFESNGTGYMVMDYEEGESLAQWLKRVPQPPEAELRRLLMPLLDGLAAVHAAKFLHRDIKPNNIFIRSGGSPVLLDFGAARATGSGSAAMTAVLTPGYAPLEQYSAEGRQGPWTDIYALGGVLFRAVTGHNPPDAVSRLQKDGVAESLAAARGRYSEPLLNAIQWALQIQPEIRPQSVAEWKAAFEAQAQMPAAVAPPRAAAVAAAAAPSMNTRPPVKRPPRGHAEAAANWRSLGLGALLLLALLVGFELYRRQPPPAPPAPPPAARPPAPAAVDAARPPPVAESPPPAPEALRPPPDPLPSRELAPEADPRERPSRPPLLPDRAPERLPPALQGEFGGADHDRDGYLSRDEVQGRFPFIQREFGRVDLDGDGRISPAEFMALRRKQAEGLPKPKP